MKKVLKKFNRTLSIMLAAAMVLTMVPQTAMPVLAAEEEQIEVTNETAPEEEVTVPADESDDESADVGKTGETPEIPADDEQIEEDEKGEEEPSGDNETPVIDQPVEDPDTDPVEEPTEDEVVDPTIDPAPDAEEPGSSTPDSVGVNADEDEATTHKVTIKDYRTVLDSASITATVGGTDAEISNNGEITVELAKGETSKALALTVTAKEHRKVKSVESGETKGTITGNNGSLSLTITKDTADAEVTITTVETYDFTLDNDAATGITLQRLVTNAEGKTVKEAFGNGTYEKDGEALQFVTSYTANNDSLTVSYAADGEDDETPLTGALQDDPTSDTGKPQVVIYTIPSTALADLDELAITLVKNEQVAVTFAANDKVEVQVWGEKTPASGDTAAVMDWIDIPAAGYKVIAGEKAKFKAVAKDPYTITAVKANTGADGAVEKISDPSTNGEYEFTVTKATEFSFDTEYDSNKSKTLTFKLDGDKGSATAKITGVTLKATTAGGADTVLAADTTPTLAAFLTGLGLTNGELEVDKGVKIPNTVAKIKVEVTAVAANGYDLAKINNTDVTADEKTAGKAEKEIAYDSIGDWTATTAAKKSAGDTFFKIVLPEAVKHITLNTGASTAADATVSTVADVANTYKVKSGTDTVSITMTAEEGWVLGGTFETALKATAGVADVKSEVKDKKTVYTVKLLATKLGTTANDAATDLGTIAEAVQSFTAEVDTETSSKAGYNVGEYTVTPVEAFPAVGEADETNIPYNAKLETAITATNGYTLAGVSYTMDGAAAQTVEVLNNKAEIVIEKVTGDVKIKVETAEAYDISLSAATGSDIVEPDQPGLEKGDETWAVKYNGKYAIDVSPAVDIKDLSAEIKDGSTIIGRGKKIGGELQLWMNRVWAGKELTVDVKAKDVKIGELVLQVNKKRSTLAVKAEGTIKQDVASTAVYEIETDGEKLPEADLTPSGDLASKIEAEINADGNLEITVLPAKFADINTVATTGSGDDAVRTVTPKTATITITDPEDNTLKAKATVQANAVFDTISKPSVSLVDGGASDTDLVVSVGMDGIIAPKKGSSKVFYVITADAKPDTAKTDTTEESKRDQDKLKDTITKVVERKGSSQRVTLDVGKANLGDGAAWDYDVTARVVYALNGAKPSDSVKAAAVADGANSDISALSDKLETSTVDTLFEAGLKLKKDGKKKPASTLYTGQENLYIATPQWSKKNVNYKIAEAEVVDLTYHYYDEDGELCNYGGLNAEINDAGDLVVTSVDTDAYLGKHTLQVTAKADMTAGHTMYASRATITVNVVKGINRLDAYVPGNQIFKQNNKAATYKATVGYDFVWNNNKKVYPKSKKVKWSVVGADSMGEFMDDSAYYGDIDEFTLTAAPAGITIKNGTVTVAKNFTVDARHPQNNAFKVLVQADDFAGNKTAALSSTVYITDKALDVSNIIIARRNYEKGGYDVIAVKEGTKSAKAQDVKAEDIDSARVYAAAKTVAPGFVSYAKWDTLDVVDEWNLTYAPTKGNVLTVNSSGWIDVKTPGKKATITVTAQDGSKKKNSIALNMGYTLVDSTAALKITAYDAQNEGKKVEVTKAPTKEADAAAKVEKDFALPGVVELDVDVYVAQRDDKGAFKKFEEINNYSNYKLTVSGGKYVNDTIYTTAKKTTLNLTVGAGRDAKKYSYVLTNTAYDAAGKAKVTVKNALHTWGSEEEQKVKMTALNGKDSFGDNKYVKVELDQTAKPKYNSNPGANNSKYYAWNYFSEAIKSHYIKLDKATGEFDLEFVDPDDGLYYDEGYVALDAGSYKLKVTVGTGATAAAFKADTQPVTVTVKVNKNKAFTFKPVTSYTINKVDGGAVLTGKANVNVKAGEKVRVDFYNLQNANVNGKSNLFTHYFKLEEDKVTGTVRLTLNTEDPLVEKLLYETKEDGSVDKTKPIADPDLSALSKDKKNLTGYVTYYAEPSVNYYNWEGEKTVKITVKIAPEAKNNKYKATQKYNPESGTEIGLKKGNKTEVNILVNGAYVSVAHAIIDDSKAKSNAAELTNVTVNAKGQIVLEAASDLDPEKKGGYTTNLLIVPAASYYADAITGTTKAEDKKALIERYGIPVKVTVAAKEKPKATPDPTAPKRPSEPDDPTPVEKTEDEVKAMVEAWIDTLTGTNTWLKNDTTVATLTTKANTDTDIAESGWTVNVTTATFASATAATANAAATQGAAITYTLKKGADGTPTSPITSTAKITLPAGALGTSEVVSAVGSLGPKVTVSNNPDATAIQGAVTTALNNMLGKANIDNYYTITVGDVTGTISSANDTATVAVTVTPKDGGTAGNASVDVTGE